MSGSKIAVMTISGKAYYEIANELKKRAVPFLSLTPNETVPVDIKVVISTEREKPLIRHSRVLIQREGESVEALANEALRIAQGKESFEKVTIGIDPGDITGLAVVADGKTIETANCYNLEETLRKVESILGSLRRISVSLISVKIGDGALVYREKLIRSLDKILPMSVELESVSEAGTNSCLKESEHRRGRRHIISAMQIAGRSGLTFQRRKRSETDS